MAAEAHEGTWLAFDVARDGTQLAFDLLGQIWVVPVSGGNARALTDALRDTAEDGDPAFLPDGRSVVFAGERRGHAGLWRVELASGAVRRLTVPPDRDDQPAVSPDGRWLGFIRAVDGFEGDREWSFSGLHLLDLEGGAGAAARLIPFGADGHVSVRDPSWSADGRTIYVIAPRGRLPATPVAGPIWAIDVASGRATLVSDSMLAAFAPSPSPDMRHLAYAAVDSGGRWQLWLRDLAEGRVQRLTAEQELTPRRIRWSRDGSSLFYVAGGRFRRLDLDGLRSVEIPFRARLAFARARPPLPQRRFPAPGTTQPARGQMGLALSPDGRRVAMLALGRLWLFAPGGNPRAVATVPEGARDPDWAPGQALVAYSVGSWGEENVVLMDLATGSTSRLTHMPGREMLPRFSPDGRWIAFVREAHDSASHILVLPANVRDASDLSQARDLGEVDLGEWAVGLATPRAPVWSPDGRSLLVVHAPAGPFVREPFHSLRPNRAELIALDGTRRALAGAPFDATWVRWPNDTTVLFLSADRLWRSRIRLERARWDDPVPLGDDPALYLSAADDGSALYVSGDGLRLRAAKGSIRRLGWPVRFRVPEPPPLVIRNARVVDGTGSPPSAPRDLTLRAGRIEAIGPPGSARRSAGATVLDAGGAMVLPGLADLHFHYNGPEQLRGLLYNGITVIRDQGSDIATLAARADGGAAGVWAAPRISFGGFQFYTDWDMSDGLEQGLEPERDSGQIGRAVALLVAHGAEHMKIRTFHGWAATTRLIEAAHRFGLRTTGHCVFPLPLIAAGMEAKEHLGNTCDARFDAPLHEDVLGVLKVAGVAVDPTTIAYSWWQMWLDDRRIMRGPDVAPFTPALKLDATFWAAQANPDYWIRRQGRTMLDQTAALHAAGIELGLGTDVPELPWAAHLELQRLVEAGLTPLEAIRAGTLNSARILGHDQEAGTIAPGKIADLLVLEPAADPTRDIRDTRRIRWVILGGKVVDREGLKTVR